MSYKVKLREKKINGGKKSLYLDFYPPIPLKASDYKKNKKGELSRSKDNNIPKQRLGKYVKISKLHFDELFVIGV